MSLGGKVVVRLGLKLGAVLRPGSGSIDNKSLGIMEGGATKTLGSMEGVWLCRKVGTLLGIIEGGDPGLLGTLVGSPPKFFWLGTSDKLWGYSVLAVPMPPNNG